MVSQNWRWFVRNSVVAQYLSSGYKYWDFLFKGLSFWRIYASIYRVSTRQILFISVTSSKLILKVATCRADQVLFCTEIYLLLTTLLHNFINHQRRLRAEQRSFTNVCWNWFRKPSQMQCHWMARRCRNRYLYLYTTCIYSFVLFVNV